jgi:UPF0755 protein
LSRGNRSRPTSERTAEERERAREERARRRAGRTPGQPDATPDARAPADAGLVEPFPPQDPDAREDLTPSADLPASHDARTEHHADESQDPSVGQPAASEATWAPVARQVASDPAAEIPTSGDPAAEPPSADVSPVPPEEQAPAASHEAPSTDQVSAASHEAPPAAPYDEPPATVEHETLAAPPPAPSPPELHTPPPTSPPAEPAIPPAEPAIPPAELAIPPAELAIPPAEPVIPPPASPPPPRVSSAGISSAREVSITRPVPPRSDGRMSRGAAGRGRRSPLARLAAIVALLAAIAAVILLVRSLSGSSHAKIPPPPAVVRVLIPEGETRLQIARLAAADGLTGSYRDAAKRSPVLNPAHYGAPSGTADLEGFLFPATYEMNPHAPARRLVEEQLVAFKENFGAEETQRARALHLTPYQLLTVASMIEREAQVPSDRAKIAAVIYNRLRRGMPLGIDATIYYAIEMRQGLATYTQELTEAQLHIESPYNTRLHTGLPPTPISNPGVASIQAAGHPAHDSYLYYVDAADGCGNLVFSTTLAQFEVNAAAYQAAVRKNGGHQPSCKKK